MLTALLGTKGLLLLNIVYVCMTPTWSLLPIRVLFLLSLTHTFTSHTDLAFMLYHTSYCSYCLITNIETIVTKNCPLYMIPTYGSY